MLSWPSILVLMLGLVLGFLLGRLSTVRRSHQLHAALDQMERRHARETEALLDGVKLAFADISADLFKRFGDRLYQHTQTTLTTDRKLQGQELDGHFGRVAGQLEKMHGLVRTIEQDRAAQFGQLSERLARTDQASRELFASTDQLRRLFQSSQQRGQWGERLAEDLLSRAGFVEHQNYRKQAGIGATGLRPDITFDLAADRVVHMDVKFPLENWINAGNADGEASRRRFETSFSRDVRRAVDELAGRGYAQSDPRSIDLAIMFLPNEPAFASAMALEPQLLDRALAQKILLASPYSLIAVLMIIRESVRSFSVTISGRQLLDELRELERAWEQHRQQLERIENTVAQASRRIGQLGGGKHLSAIVAKLNSLSGSNMP